MGFTVGRKLTRYRIRESVKWKKKLIGVTFGVSAATLCVSAATLCISALAAPFLSRYA
jgi:hypothetical protein